MADRIGCCVPFCRRTIGTEKLPPTHNEWICSRHWPLVPRGLKRRKRQTENRVARIKRMWDDNPRGHEIIDGSGRYLKYCHTLARAYQAKYTVWAKCKVVAIERSAGI